MIFKFFWSLLENLGIKNDLIYINKIIPRDKNIFYFILLFFLSFILFLNTIFLIYFYFIYFILNFFFLKKKKNKVIYIDNINNYKNSLFFFYKELVINPAKTKAFIYFYNFLKIIYVKKTKTVNIKLLFFNFFFNLIIFIPFTIFKISCKIYKSYKNISELNLTNKIAVKCILDNILLNLYTKYVFNEIEIGRSYKIFINGNNIKFSSLKTCKYIFKYSSNYFIQKIYIKNMLIYKIFENKKKGNNFVYKHSFKLHEKLNKSCFFKKNEIFNKTTDFKILGKSTNKKNK